VSEAIISVGALVSRVVIAYTSDAKEHLVEIAGSLFGSLKLLGLFLWQILNTETNVRLL
jgi:hypothetical protein